MPFRGVTFWVERVSRCTTPVRAGQFGCVPNRTVDTIPHMTRLAVLYRASPSFTVFLRRMRVARQPRLSTFGVEKGAPSHNCNRLRKCNSRTSSVRFNPMAAPSVRFPLVRP